MSQLNSIEQVIETGCASCNKPFTIGQYVYEIKLDSGSIVRSHGYPCANSFQIKRIPIKAGDWWIKQIGIVRVVQQ